MKTEGKKGERLDYAPSSQIMIFRKLKKAGGQDFKEAVLLYKSRCAGHGRGRNRPSFEWLRYQMLIEVASRMQAGTKAVWMTQKMFMAYMKPIDEMDVAAAAIEWEKRAHGKDHKTDNTNGVQRLLVAAEEFVVTMNEQVNIPILLRAPATQTNPEAEGEEPGGLEPAVNPAT